MGKPFSRNIIKKAWLQNLNSGEHQGRFGRRNRFGHPGKPGYQAVARLYDAEALARCVSSQHQRRERVLLPMRFERCLKIDIRDQLSVYDDESFAAEQLSRVIKRATGAQNLRLVNILELHSKLAAVAERGAD